MSTGSVLRASPAIAAAAARNLPVYAEDILPGGMGLTVSAVQLLPVHT